MMLALLRLLGSTSLLRCVFFTELSGYLVIKSPPYGQDGETDVTNFDTVFTREKAEISPTDPSRLEEVPPNFASVVA